MKEELRTVQKVLGIIAMAVSVGLFGAHIATTDIVNDSDVLWNHFSDSQFTLVAVIFSIFIVFMVISARRIASGVLRNTVTTLIIVCGVMLCFIVGVWSCLCAYSGDVIQLNILEQNRNTFLFFSTFVGIIGLLMYGVAEIY